jgi:4-amino-4-deoxy-L-arabinose transferase-like glycosyltransferase
MGEDDDQVGPSRAWERVGLTLIVLLAAGLRIWRLDQNGYGNLYQAATVRSMTLSWHNFFYAAFDPAGFLSVDKPPFAFWIEAACARLLGFRGCTMMLPQALEGVAAMGLIYHLVRRRFGGEAGLLAGLALAIMPVSVAVDRSNYADSCLVLVILLASWAIVVAAEGGRLVPLLASAALVGVGFNTKMLVGLGVLPAFGLVYLLGAPLAWRARLVRLAAALAVLVAVSASWALVVELTPPEHRPYVGGSRDNSVRGLALGYNGLERVLGLGGTTPSSPLADYLPGEGRTGMPGFGGPPGPLRLANRELAGQITWLIPLAALGSIAAMGRERFRWPVSPKHLAILLWAGWLASYAAVFSFSRGIIHPYYLSIIAPPVAALFGVGASALRATSGRGRWGSLALSTALILTSAWQSKVLVAHPAWRDHLLPWLAGGAAASVTGLLAARFLGPRWSCSTALGRASLAVGLLAVLLTPAAWSLMPVVAPGNPMIPVADPSLLTGTGELAAPPVDLDEILPLVNYLRAHRREERYLVATTNVIVAGSIIVKTGEPVMATRGFLGTDPILTPAQLAREIGTGQVRFALVPIPAATASGRPAGGILGRPPVGGRTVSPDLWRPDLVPAGPDVPPAALAPSRIFAVPSGRRVSALGLLLRQMELIDCRPGDE